MNPPTTLTNHNPPATIGCGLNPNPIRREESDTPQLIPALYDIRSNRGVGHVGGDVDSNQMDATLVVQIASPDRSRELVSGRGVCVFV